MKTNTVLSPVEFFSLYDDLKTLIFLSILFFVCKASLGFSPYFSAKNVKIKTEKNAKLFLVVLIFWLFCDCNWTIAY